MISRCTTTVLIVAALYLFILNNSLASTNQITFVNKDGTPIVNAVVSLIGTPAAPSQHSHQSNAAVMDQVDIQYSPRVLIIQKNDWVNFPNSDSVRHHVYSFSPSKQFEIKMYQGSEADPINFEQSGIVTLGCNIHDSMVGYIFVADGEKTLKSNEEGIVTFDEAVSTIKVWHEDLMTQSYKLQEFHLAESKSHHVITLDVLTSATDQVKPKMGFGNKFKRGD